MKIAICFYGYFGNTNISRVGRNNQLNSNTLNDYNEMWSINHFKKYVIQNYDVDIFFHCWNNDNKELLLKHYKPKKYLFEDQQKIFPFSDKKYINHNYYTIKCRYYSEYKSIELILKYQKEHNFEYDMVMHTIFDQLFFSKIEFDKLDKNYIYNSFWNSNSPIKKNNIHYDKKSGLYDQWYISNIKYLEIISNKETMYKYFELYPYDKYGGHYSRLKLFEDCNLIDKLRFYLYVGIDHIKCNQLFTPQYRHLLKQCIN